MNGFLIAGTNSGSGKTTVTIGLMNLLKKMGKEVNGFKCGPDYIDPMFHKFVLEKPSYNLDTWMNDSNTVKYLFEKHSSNGGVSIVEGVMGMYDGFDAKDFKGSGYHVAKTLDIPVILVIDGSSMASSVAAIAKGFAELMPDSNVAGVIINNVASPMHYEHLIGAMKLHTDIDCIGYVKRNPDIRLDSRHLGLIQAEEIEDLSGKLDLLSESLKETIDVELLLEKTGIDSNRESFISTEYIEAKKEIESKISQLKTKFQGKTVGVAKDKAFTFYYEDNLELFKECGMEIKYFSPLNDNKVPDNLDLIYLGGGYPEVYAEKLGSNHKFIGDLKNKLDNGANLLAECGGLMYLMDTIQTLEGSKFNMLGFIHGDSEMTHKLQHFGYVHTCFKDEKIVRAHEFHKSIVTLKDEEASYKYTVEKRERKWDCGIGKNNAVGTYSHVHFYSNLEYLDWMMSK